MEKMPLKFKITAMALVLVFFILPLNKINSHTYPQAGVYICGPSPCLDHSPNHLSFFCDSYHKIIY